MHWIGVAGKRGHPAAPISGLESLGCLEMPTPVSDQFTAFMEVGGTKGLTPAVRDDIKEDIENQFQNRQATIVPKDKNRSLSITVQRKWYKNIHFLVNEE